MQRQDILKDNLIECLRISDRTIITSFGVLFVGAVTAKHAAGSGTITLPLDGLPATPLETALWLLLGLHFVNGLRYLFLQEPSLCGWMKIS